MSIKKVAVQDEFNWQLNVKSRITAATLGGLSPTKGDRYILTDGANLNKIGIYNGATWTYLTPLEGWICWVNDEDKFYKFDGNNWSMYIDDTNNVFDSYTKLASHFNGPNGAQAYNDPIAGPYTFVGTAHLDTSYKVFGTASLLLDGNSDYVTLPDSSSWDFGTGDFTIDLRVRWNAFTIGDYTGLVSQYIDTTHCWDLRAYGDSGTAGTLRFIMINGASSLTVIGTISLSLNTWYHIEVVRSGNDWTLRVNGVAGGTATATNTITMPDLAAVLVVGMEQYNAVPLYHNGWIDELRISKGVARHTANFTPPTREYSSLPETIAVDKLFTPAISFPTIQVADAGANVLDDYEEGTFTSVVGFDRNAVGVVYVNQYGSYVKIGSMCIFNIYVAISSKGSSTGAFAIGGLPFSRVNDSTYTVPVTIDPYTGVSFSNMLVAFIPDNDTWMNVQQVDGTGAAIASVTNAGIADSTYIFISGAYRTN